MHTIRESDETWAVDIEARIDPDHPVFIAPDQPDATIWRYMDFTRLVSLLETSRLFFARCDTLNDPFEGSVTSSNVTRRAELLGAQGDADIARWQEAERRWTFVSCWNLSERESAALWGLYVPATGGVAVRSTYRRLTECFGPIDPPLTPGDGVQRIYIGRVIYADYEHVAIPDGNGFWPFVHKRTSFNFENELRALMSQPMARGFYEGTGPPGKTLAQYLSESPDYLGLAPRVDLHRLVEAIHVSPAAPAWFHELVCSVVARYGLSRDLVRQSQMAGSPVY